MRNLTRSRPLSDPGCRTASTRLVAALSLTAVLAVGAAACGGSSAGSGAGSGAGGVADGPTGPSAERGEEIVRDRGCAGCHGNSFDGGAGPSWVGLAGAEVTLVDGSTVTADDAYLTRAIADPGAELSAGYTLQMPRNSLSDAEIADVVAFIKTLTEG